MKCKLHASSAINRNDSKKATD